jgi:DNA-binding XRE family transcriptional regulator
MGKGQRLLRVLRAEQEPNGITQGDLAKLVGMHRLRYRSIEHGEIDPTDDERSAIAWALHVKPSDIAWPACARARAS